MRIPKQLYCAVCAAGVAILTMPPVAFGHDQRSMTRRHDAQNLAPTEFFTQAERDLVARVQDHLAADPSLAPVASNLAIDAEIGTITLRGSLPTQADKERVISKVERVLGVERVKDEIRITNSASVSPSVVPSRETVPREASVTTGTRVGPRSAVVAPGPQRTVTSFPATGSRGGRAADDQASPGSGQMAEEDRTGTSGPSGTRSTSPLNTGAIDTIGRVTKPAGDYAVTEVDRGLASQLRLALSGHPNMPVTEENVHLVVDNGFVTLQGWVPSEQDRLAIAEHVRGISGVQGIDNQLLVRPHRGAQAGR